MMQEYFVKSYTQDIIPSGTARSSMDLVILRQCFDVMYIELAGFLVKIQQNLV